MKLRAPFDDLMANAQAGDARAYTLLLEGITPLIRAYVAKRISQQDMVEDVVQEVLISLHQARHTYIPKSPFKPWLFSICRYRLLDYLRRHYRTRGREEDYDTTIFPVENGDGDVTETLDARERVSKALALLNPKQQKIVTLMKVEGYSAAEVAVKMDMSVSAVKVSAHRALKKMQKQMKEVD